MKLFKILIALLAIAGAATAKSFTYDDLEEAKAYADKRNKPLVFVQGLN